MSGLSPEVQRVANANLSEAERGLLSRAVHSEQGYYAILGAVEDILTDRAAALAPTVDALVAAERERVVADLAAPLTEAEQDVLGDGCDGVSEYMCCYRGIHRKTKEPVGGRMLDAVETVLAARALLAESGGRAGSGGDGVA